MRLSFIKTTDDENTFRIVGFDASLWDTPTPLVIGKLTRLPGSPGIWVSHGLTVPEEHRGKGYSRQYDEYVKHLAFNQLEATAILASVKQTNYLQHQRLRKLGWKPISGSLWLYKRKATS